MRVRVCFAGYPCVRVCVCVAVYLCMLQVFMTPSAGALRLVQVKLAFFFAPRLFANIKPTPLEGTSNCQNQANPHAIQVGPGGHLPMLSSRSHWSFPAYARKTPVYW